MFTGGAAPPSAPRLRLSTARSAVFFAAAFLTSAIRTAWPALGTVCFALAGSAFCVFACIRAAWRRDMLFARDGSIHTRRTGPSAWRRERPQPSPPRGGDVRDDDDRESGELEPRANARSACAAISPAVTLAGRFPRSRPSHPPRKRRLAHPHSSRALFRKLRVRGLLPTDSSASHRPCSGSGDSGRRMRTRTAAGGAGGA